MQNKLPSAVVVLFSLMLLNLSAIEFQYQNEGIMEENGIFAEDYLFAGHNLVFRGEAEDLYFAGKELTMEGSTRKSLTAFGERIFVNGNIGNDLILGAGHAELAGNVEGTVFIGSGDVIVTKEANLRGDLFVAGGTVLLSGPVEGDLRVGAGQVTIGSTMKGDVYIGAGKIFFTDNGRIDGNLTYTSERSLEDNIGEKVTGTVYNNEEYQFNLKDLDEVVKGWGVAQAVIAVMAFLSIIILGILILLLPLCRHFAPLAAHKKFWSHALWGLIPFFLYPLATVLLFLPVITIPLALMLLLAYIPVMMVTFILGLTLSGQYIFGIFGWKPRHRVLYFLTGLLCAIILGIIPVLKSLSFILFSSLGWGVIIVHIYKYHHNREQED